MSVHDTERAITNACAIIRELEQRYLAALAGLQEAQRGITRLHTSDDHRPLHDPQGPPVIPTPDQAALDLRAVEHHATQLLAAARSLYDRLVPYRRLGLPRDHPDRAPTKDERTLAEGESLDDDKVCVSCIRIGAEALRHPGLKLCQWCYGVVKEFKPMWPQMTMPPVDLVRLHHEAVMGRTRISQQEMIRRLTICFGTPRKVTS